MSHNSYQKEQKLLEKYMEEVQRGMEQDAFEPDEDFIEFSGSEDEEEDHLENMTRTRIVSRVPKKMNWKKVQVII